MVLGERANRQEQANRLKSQTASIDIFWVLDLLEDMKSVIDQGLISCFYITGARLSEIIRHRINNREGLRYRDIHVNEDKKYIQISTLKRRKQSFRQIPIIDDPKRGIEVERRIASYFLRYYNVCDPEEEFLFDFSGRKAHRIMNKYYLDKSKTIPLSPHFFRHLRLTHLVKYYNFNPFYLMNFAGWSSISPALEYVKLAGSDISNYIDNVMKKPTEKRRTDFELMKKPSFNAKSFNG